MLRYDINRIKRGDALYVEETDNVYGGLAVVNTVELDATTSDGQFYNAVTFMGIPGVYDLDYLLDCQDELERTYLNDSAEEKPEGCDEEGINT